MNGSLYVLNEDPVHFSIQYFDNADPALRKEYEARWQSFNRHDPVRRQTYKILLRQTNDQPQVAVDHLMPGFAVPGRYRVETFVPAVHATTRQAAFAITTGLQPGENGDIHLQEQLVLVDMQDIHDAWFSLGEYSLDPSLHAYVGRVRQLDLSHEDPPAQVSFGPLRWVPLMHQPEDGLLFDAPVGTPEERQEPIPTGRFFFGRYPAWAGSWFDANPFCNWYSYGYHTGADLNLPGVSAADKGKPVYAIGDGVVTYAGRAGTWGSTIVIRHPEAWVTNADGEMHRQMVYSRYGHVEPQVLVRAGQSAERGQQIGAIGLAAGMTTGWHLHFDVSHSDMLKNRPSYWPDLSALRSLRGSKDTRSYQGIKSSIMRQVLTHFIDPLKFLRDNHYSN